MSNDKKLTEFFNSEPSADDKRRDELAEEYSCCLYTDHKDGRVGKTRDEPMSTHFKNGYDAAKTECKKEIEHWQAKYGQQVDLVSIDTCGISDIQILGFFIVSVFGGIMIAKAYL